MRSARSMHLLAGLLIVSGVAVLLYDIKLDLPDSLRFAIYGLPALPIVLGAAILGPTHCPRILVFIGDASYSIYLSHVFFVMAYSTAYKHFSILRQLPPDAVILVASLLTIALTSLTYPLIERPLTRAITRSVTRSKSPQAA